MYICICNAVTDREIRGAVAGGARCLADLKAMLAVATCCGRCADSAQGIVREMSPAPAEHAGGDD